MKKSLVTAGILGLVITAIHVFLGGADTLGPMLATDLAPTAKATMHAGWHIVSADLLLSALGLVAAGVSAERVGRTLPLYIAAQYLLWMAVFAALWTSPGLDQPLLDLPQPFLFVPSLALIAFGVRR